jgi:homoserine O-acetyltransferase
MTEEADRMCNQQMSGVGLVETNYFTSRQPLVLESGAVLPEVTLAYETYGRLNAHKDNAILLLHALSGDAHAAGRHHPTDRKPGWWDDMVGPGRAFDTDKYFVICSNVIGGCKGSSGPTVINPATGARWQADFPVVTIADMVAAQVRLIDALGIPVLRAVAGGSMGGFQALQWMSAHGQRVRAAILLATSAWSSPQAVAWNAIGRQAIMRDPKWAGGFYAPDQAPVDGLAVARMVGHVTYLSEWTLQQKFPKRFQQAEHPQFTLRSELSVESYLEYQAMRFNERFDANAYLYITKAMDYWDLGATDAALATALAPWQGDTLLISFDSDWLYPTAESVRIAEVLRQQAKPVSCHELHSPAGHDAFLLEFSQQTPIIQAYLARFDYVGVPT